MPLEKSEAVILKMFNWSESSRTILFFTERFGKLALVDKGGRSLKSRRGRPVPFARLEVTFYRSEKETSGYIRDCETLESFPLEKNGSLGRLAYGSAACETLNLLLPEQEAQAALYAYILSYFRKLALVERQFLPALFLAFFLRVMSQLGYHPSLAFCVGCSTDSSRIEPVGDKVMFSPERGGVVCDSCQKPGEYYIGLSVVGLQALTLLQRASLDEAAAVPLGYQEAAFLVDALTDFLRYHSGLFKDLKSLEFLEKLKKTELN
jgi:DNA repair protein RecO (recombination protein O)